jgi:hypothetical protein
MGLLRIHPGLLKVVNAVGTAIAKVSTYVIVESREM